MPELTKEQLCQADHDLGCAGALLRMIRSGHSTHPMGDVTLALEITERVQSTLRPHWAGAAAAGKGAQ